MIKYECDNGKATLEIQGTTTDLLADVTLLISHLYKVFKEKDDFTADFFKFFVGNGPLAEGAFNILCKEESKSIKDVDDETSEEERMKIVVEQLIKILKG